MTASALRRAFNIADLRELAKRRLPRGIYDYVERGAEDEVGLAANRTAFADTKFLPRVLRNVAEIDAGTSLFGRPLAFPLIVAPTGSAGIVAYEGDLALARAAAASGIPFTISGASTMEVEAIAKAGGRLWFQLYLWQERALSHHVLERAAACGCEALVITCDIPVAPNREYNLRNGFGMPFRLRPQNAWDILSHPGWLLGVLARYWRTTGIPRQANLPKEYSARVTELAPVAAGWAHERMDWAEVAELRNRWPGRFILKGLLRPDDAERAVALGVDAIVVSNHGGRSLDGALASLDALPAIAAAVGKRAAILVDGGVTRGSDIAKALALGADAVLAGRAPLYGLAAADEAGVLHALELLRAEFVRTMSFLGARDVSEITPDLLANRTRPT